MYHNTLKYYCLDLIINLRLEIQHACLHVQQYIKMVFCERLDFIVISFCHSVPYGLLCYHDDVIKWKHFPCHWPFVRGIHWSPELFFSSTWTNDWVNTRDAVDLGNHRVHRVATVMGDVHLVAIYKTLICWMLWYTAVVVQTADINWFTAV